MSIEFNFERGVGEKPETPYIANKDDPKIGDIFWAYDNKYPYWPAIVCPTDSGNTYITGHGLRTRKPNKLVNVVFFGDKIRHTQATLSTLIPYKGREDFKQNIHEMRKNSRKPGVYSGSLGYFWVPKYLQINWDDAINLADKIYWYRENFINYVDYEKIRLAAVGDISAISYMTTAPHRSHNIELPAVSVSPNIKDEGSLISADEETERPAIFLFKQDNMETFGTPIKNEFSDDDESVANPDINEIIRRFDQTNSDTEVCDPLESSENRENDTILVDVKNEPMN